MQQGPSPQDQPQRRREITARIPRLLLALAGFFVFVFATRMLRQHDSFGRSLAVAAVVELVFLVVIAVLVGGVVWLMKKAEPRG